MQLLCQISKKLYGKSTPCNNLSTAFRHKTSHTDTCHVVKSVKVRNSIINIHLPLMIFIRMHSQESQFHNKCLFCLIKYIIYVQIPPFVSAFSSQIQTHEAQANVQTKSSKSYITVCRNMSNDV